MPTMRPSIRGRTPLLAFSRRLAPTRATWICLSCRQHNVQARRNQATASRPTKQGKPYYITTPIFYVNAAPHIGHMYSMVLADVLKRWNALLVPDRPALLCTGTDEHGMKVQRAAALEDIPPKQLCDTNARTFLDLARKADISNDFFVRTTDQDHKEAVEYFWDRLQERGFLYESKHEGWYCVSDEAFYPESMVEKVVSPHTGKTHMASIESGNAVEWTEEKNYHFRMTALKDKLLDFLEKNPDWIVPQSRMNEVVSWVQNNLEDLSISRPANRLDWGIRVPGDPSQTIYVWVDALVNYITKAGYPSWTPGAEDAQGWPADVHVIGKDITRFHCVYWPALLLALDIPLPKRILSHAHWTLQRKKMSKSLGNVVNPMFAVDRWGVDALRYFLVHDGGLSHDSDYNNLHFVDRYKKGLQWGLGNLVGRITRPKIWSVADAVEEAKMARLPQQQAPYVTDLKKSMSRYPVTIYHRMRELNPSAALRSIMELVYETNAYMSTATPWQLARSSDEESKKRVHEAVYHAAESLRITGLLLQPFMPRKASELLDSLGVSKDKRDFRYASLGKDFEYGTSFVDLGQGKYDGLFPPLPVED